MYFTFPCPQCGKKLKVREEVSGRKAPCPYCKTSILVPAPPAEEADSDPLAALRAIAESKPSVADKTAARSPQRRAKHASSGSSWADRTDVSMLVSGLIGLVFTGLFYAALFPLSDYYLAELFLARGWVPYVETFLLFWSMAILILKSRKLKRQKTSMLFDLLPTEISEDINEESVDKFIRHIRDLPVEPQSSFLVNRVLRGLEHFRVRKSNPEAANMLASMSDIDGNAVQSSYTLLNVFIWAIPILGFIGTVIGISDAVGSFSGSLEKAQDIAVLKQSLNNVTGGLATAFDTTLLALVMSMLVMFPSSSLQKAEDDLLNGVDEYCNENLLKRLNDGQEGAGGSGVSSGAVRRAVEAAMAVHRVEWQAWGEKIDAIGTRLTEQVVEAWEKINIQLLHRQEENVDQVHDLDAMAGAFRQSLKDMAAQTEAVHTQAAGSIDRCAESLQGYCDALQRGLAGLNDVLASLGEKQVVIQAPAARRRGWFFGRRDGS